MVIDNKYILWEFIYHIHLQKYNGCMLPTAARLLQLQAHVNASINENTVLLMSRKYDLSSVFFI